jgi:hypothetical protein
MTQYRPYYRVKANGSYVRVESEYTVGESMDGTSIRTAKIDLASNPGLSTGEPIELYRVNRDTMTYHALFKGFINSIEGVSFPNTNSLSCVGELAKLRKTRNSDFEITGLTDGGLVKNILTYCGVSYDPGDIGDAGYVLGSAKALHWQKGQSGIDLLREVDKIFGSLTMETGLGRIMRVFYDLVPDIDNAVLTFDRGNSVIYYGTERKRGDLDAIQNVWDVRGVSYDCGPDDGSCNCVPYAHATAPHAKLGAGVYNQYQSVQSDMIQDGELAKAIATREMRWHNREPDIVYIDTVNDTRINLTQVVKVKNNAVGIHLADFAPYVITAIDRSWDLMRLTCLGGGPGATDELEGGIDMTCNKTEDLTPAGPSFDLPQFSGGTTFPEPPDLVACSDTPEVCQVCDLPAPLEDCTSSITLAGGFGPVDGDIADWEMSGTLRLLDNNDGIKVGVATDAGNYTLTLAGDGWTGWSGSPMLYRLSTPGTGDGQFAQAPGSLPLDFDIRWLVRWEAANSRLFCNFETDTECVFDYCFYIEHDYSGGVTLFTVISGPLHTEETMAYNCGELLGPGPLLPTWTAEYGDWSFVDGTDGSVTFNGKQDAFCGTCGTCSGPVGSSSGQAYAGGDFPVVAPVRLHWSGHYDQVNGNANNNTPYNVITFADSANHSNWYVSMECQALSSPPFVGGDTLIFAAYGGTGFDEQPFPGNSFDFDIDVQPALDQATLKINGSLYSTITGLGSWPGAGVVPVVAGDGQHCPSELAITLIDITSG